jgi:hypothetical protein
LPRLEDLAFLSWASTYASSIYGIIAKAPKLYKRQMDCICTIKYLECWRLSPSAQRVYLRLREQLSRELLRRATHVARQRERSRTIELAAKPDRSDGV